jgi:hypothetical protein
MNRKIENYGRNAALLQRRVTQQQHLKIPEMACRWERKNG